MIPVASKQRTLKNIQFLDFSLNAKCNLSSFISYQICYFLIRITIDTWVLENSTQTSIVKTPFEKSHFSNGDKKQGNQKPLSNNFLTFLNWYKTNLWILLSTFFIKKNWLVDFKTGLWRFHVYCPCGKYIFLSRTPAYMNIIQIQSNVLILHQLN